MCWCVSVRVSEYKWISQIHLNGLVVKILSAINNYYDVKGKCQGKHHNNYFIMKTTNVYTQRLRSL